MDDVGELDRESILSLARPRRADSSPLRNIHCDQIKSISVLKSNLYFLLLLCLDLSWRFRLRNIVTFFEARMTRVLPRQVGSH